MTGFLTTTRFQIRAAAAVAVVALVLLGGARDAGATQKGVAVKVITSGIIACQAMGGTATVHSGFDLETVNNPDQLMTMSCSGGKLDGWSCEGLGDWVSCGSVKLATPGAGGQRLTVNAVVRQPADLPTEEFIVVEETTPERDVVEETDGTSERGETAVADSSIVLDAEPVADSVVADLPPAEVVATVPDVQTSDAVAETVAAEEER